MFTLVLPQCGSAMNDNNQEGFMRVSSHASFNVVALL